MCRTSPDRKPPVTSGAISAFGARGHLAGDVEDADRPARADVVGGVLLRRAGDDRLQRPQVGTRDVGDVHEVAHLGAVLVDPRRLAPLQRGAEHRRHARVRRVPGHAGPVDVVVAQRDRRGAGLAHPRGGVVLLGELAGGVAAARVEPGVLVDELPPQHGPADRAVVVEVAGLQRGHRPRAGHLGPVVGTGVAALAVDDHRGGQHQPVDAFLVHGGEQGGGAEVVVTGVRRQVGDRDPGADDRRLVADHVDPAQQVGPRGRRRRLAHVEPGGAGRRHGRAVGALEHQVDPDHLVTRGLELLPDRGADEAGRAGQQDLHATGPGTS